MLVQVKNLFQTIDNKLSLIESNKTAPVESHIIIATNEKLLREVKDIMLKLKLDSCNKALISKYEKLIDNTTTI